jgi:hypothetical protein
MTGALLAKEKKKTQIKKHETCAPFYEERNKSQYTYGIGAEERTQTRKGFCFFGFALVCFSILKKINSK